jgi:hypothetical protein
MRRVRPSVFCYCIAVRYFTRVICDLSVVKREADGLVKAAEDRGPVHTTMFTPLHAAACVG